MNDYPQNPVFTPSLHLLKAPKPLWAPIFHNCSLCSLPVPFPPCSLSSLFPFLSVFLFLLLLLPFVWFLSYFSHSSFPPFSSSFFLPLLLLELEVEPSVIKSGKNLTDGPCFHRFWTFWGTVSHFFGLFCD